MKKIIFLLGLISPLISLTQITLDQQNLEKYWKFRNTFREQFIKIGPLAGESLPAGSISPCACVDDLYPSEDGTEWAVTCYGEMHWGDGMIRHGHYLGLLATEYRLLKNSGEDVTAVLNELFFALNAINRLDFNAEPIQSEFYLNYQLPQNLNGFFLREDVGQGFALNWADEETLMRGTHSVYYHNERASGGAPNGGTVRGNSYQNVPSNDQVSSLMVGLSLVHKLVDNVFVQPPSSTTGFGIITETAAIVDRMVRFAADHNWQLIDVNGWPVANGGGDLLLMAYPLIKASERITGLAATSYNLGFTRRAFPYNWLQHCITGYGSDDQISQSDACDEMGLYQNSQYGALSGGAVAGPLNNQNSSVFQSWELSGDLGGNINATASAWQNTIPNTYSTVYSDYADDKKLSFLPWPFNLITWDKLDISDYNNTILFNYGVITGQWTKNQAAAFAGISGNKCLELANAVIRNEAPLSAQSSYRSYLDGMSHYGPYNMVGVNDAGLELNKYHENGWASEYRWNNPTESLDGTGRGGMFSALDYMLYHNLYYLLFENQLPPYKEKYNCFCLNEVVNPFSSIPSSTFDDYSSGIVAQTNNNLNQKLTYLPNCVADVFEPVNHLVSIVFDINPKFSNYASLKILTNKFQTEHATIANNGQVNLRTRLIVCNTKTLTVASGAKIDIFGGELILNPLSVLDVYGEVHLHTDSKMKMSGANSKIIIRPGGKLILDDNTLLVNDYASVIEFYNGGEIISYGGNSEIIMRGTIKMMNGGVFEIKQYGSEAGKLIIEGPSPSFLSLQPSEIRLYGKFKGDSFITIKKDSRILVYNSSLSPSFQITKFSIDNCSVILEANAKIRIEQYFFSSNVIYSSISPNLGITATDRTRFHRNDFINVHINAPLNLENIAKIYVYNCLLQKTFNYPNEPGALLTVEGMGYDIYNSIFKGKSLYCLNSRNLIIPSSIRSCQFMHNNLITTGNTVTGLADNSNVEIFFTNSNFHNLYMGIIKNAGKMTLKCNTFTDVLSYNLFASNHCLINISTESYAGYNSFGKTYISSIGLSTANINLNLGRNYFDNLSPFYISGSLYILCGVNSDCSISALKNQWGTTLAPPLNSKFQIVGTDNLPFMVSANQTEVLPICGYYDVTAPNGNGLPNQAAFGQAQGNGGGIPRIVTHFNPDIRLDFAIKYGISKMQTVDSLGDDLEAIATFGDIFNNNLSKNNPVIRKYLIKSLDYMKTAHENALANNLISSNANNGAFNIHTQKYIDALNYMTDTIITTNNYTQQFYHDLDKAHLYRVIGHSDKGLEILNELEYCGLDFEEQQELNYWKKQYLRDEIINQFGTLLLDTTILIDTTNFLQPVVNFSQDYHFGAIINNLFDISYPNCAVGSGYRMADSQVNSPRESYTLHPNPSDNIINIVYNSNEIIAPIREIHLVTIYSSEGKIIHNQNWDSNIMNEIVINVSQWSQGTYYYEIQNQESSPTRGKFVVME